MDVIFYDKLASKGFWGIQDSDNVGTNIGSIKKKKGGVFLVSFKRHTFPHPTGNRIVKKGFMVNCLSFKSLEDAKAFATNQLTGK
tara:strand:- start:162 stop:416 length:255 start_codon:yes stop_codon:yes gene_type:complete